jgi:hypothetical protein
MNRLDKKTGWVRFAKTGKKQGINAGEQPWKGGFLDRTEPV